MSFLRKREWLFILFSAGCVAVGNICYIPDGVLAIVNAVWITWAGIYLAIHSYQENNCHDYRR